MSKIANLLGRRARQARNKTAVAIKVWQKTEAPQRQDPRPLLNPKDVPDGTYDFVVTGIRVKKENGQGVVQLQCVSTDPKYQPTTLTLPYPFTLQFEEPSRIIKPQAGQVPLPGALPSGTRVKKIH